MQMPSDALSYRVAVRNNLVVGIEPATVPPGVRVAATPLEASSMLAHNHKVNGSLDGVYYLPDADMARHVAFLSLDFIEKIVRKSIESLNAATLHPNGWRSPFTGHAHKPAEH